MCQIFFSSLAINAVTNESPKVPRACAKKGITNYFGSNMGMNLIKSSIEFRLTLSRGWNYFSTGSNNAHVYKTANY